jgi:ribosomal peptide maturation radical SAM protein 1
MPRVALVNMPFASPRWPNLGLGLLKAALARRGIACDVVYLNLDFAEQIGLEDYLWLADAFGFVLGGERLFAKHFFGEDGLPDDEQYYRDILLQSDPQLGPDQRAEYEKLGRQIPAFLDQALASRDWRQYDIVGFSSSFQQTMPSLCLARLIKQRHSDVKIMFGGAACESEMGVEILSLFPLIDYVFLGEADLTFPEVVRQILAGAAALLPPGVAARTGACRVATAELCRTSVIAELDHAAHCNLDDLPFPDFDDYFDGLRRSPLSGEIDPILFFETSRGCWWGQRHHCAFCGLNGRCLTYRSKSPQRVVEELRCLTDRYQVRRACATDNIFDHRYFDTLLPLLKEASLGVGFMFEMRAAVSRSQTELLCAAGMAGVQLGIETFSTPLLKLIDKGTTAVQNLQTLKWFSEAGVIVEWNLLYGFAGEDPSEYSAMAELLPSLYHLAPPQGCGRVRSDRFSPYFTHPERHGIANVRPGAAFAYVFPFPPDALARLAYYFDFDYADGRRVEEYVGPILERIGTWRELAGNVALRMFDRGDGVLLVHDTRPGATAFQQRFTGLERELYVLCDTGQPLEKILDCATRFGPPAVDEAAVHEMLKSWIDARIMVYIDDRYLSLALRTTAGT